MSSVEDPSLFTCKWIVGPLVFVYIEQFNFDDPLFKKLSKHTSELFASSKFDNASSLVGLVRSLNLFDIFDGPKNTAYSIAQSRRSFHDWIRIHDLWPSFGTSPFAEAAFNAYQISVVHLCV